MFRFHGSSSVLRLFSVAIFATVFSIGFVSPTSLATKAEAGSLRSGVKMGGGKKVKSRSMGSGGQRMMRSGGGKRVSGIRAGGGHKIIRRSMGGSKGAKTYIKRRSVLDGNYDRSGGKRRGGEMMHGRGHDGKLRNNRNIRQTAMHGKRRAMGGNNHKGRGGRDIAKNRSGVTYMGSRRNVSSFREIAGGSRTVITKRRLGGSYHGKNGGGHNGHRVATGFSASGLVVVGVVSQSATQGMVPIAGGNDDCAYGTYCTIDLGGPKIITYNDVGDISGDEIIEDEGMDGLSEEEYKRRYGTK